MGALKQAVQASIAGNYWTQLGTKTAPAGKLRMMHVDPRDHEATHHGDYESVAEIRTELGTMIYAQREVMEVYNDKGQLVII